MEDRWSLADRQVYGAEDDAEMDAIMRAIDEADAKDAERQSSTSSRSQKNSR